MPVHLVPAMTMPKPRGLGLMAAGKVPMKILERMQAQKAGKSFLSNRATSKAH
jgi:hypothetical protein